MTDEEYKRYIADGWNDAKSPIDHWWGKVLFALAMLFIGFVGGATIWFMIKMGVPLL